MRLFRVRRRHMPIVTLDTRSCELRGREGILLPGWRLSRRTLPTSNVAEEGTVVDSWAVRRALS
jgi:hypothetical protein